MSNEINMSVSLQCSNGNFKPPAWSESASFTQNAIGGNGGVVNLTTTYSVIPLGSIATNGFTMVKNLDATNNVDVGLEISAALVAFVTLKPTEFAIFRYKSGTVPAAKAVTSTAKLQVWMLND